MKLTKAQTRELMLAFRSHPATYSPTRAAVPARLASMGLFEAREFGAFALTPTGIDLAVRSNAQRIIDRVADARKAAPAAVATPVEGDGRGRPPATWPFPVSRHQW